MIKPVDFSISSPFGWRLDPITHTKEHHDGCDYRAPSGSLILVPIDCRIIRRWDMDKLNGNALRIESLDRLWRFGFAHLSAFAITASVGAIFKAGDVIGYTGNTGHSFGPHLHMTVWNRPAIESTNDTDFRLVDPETIVWTPGVC